MRRPIVCVTVLLAVGWGLFAGGVRAQLTGETEFPDQRRWDLSINSGVLLAEQELAASGILGDVDNIFVSLESDGGETAFGLTGDLVYRFGSGVRFGGQFGWSPMTLDFDVVEVDDQPIQIGQNRELNLYLYSLTIGYTTGFNSRFGMFGSAGLGGATQSFEDERLLLDGADIYNDDSNTSFQTPLTIGARYALTRSIAIDVLARDHLIFGNDDLGGTSHNIYVGGGISYMF